ncbi:MAG: RNA-binding protein [Oscillospiraceae bacterium]|nr:RNA-binding protein [Oscillospiraceae bacterium]
MEKRKQIDAIAESEEERMLLVRVCDKLERGYEREMPVSTGFLTLREQALVKQLLPHAQFWGGVEEADRKVAYYLPEYMSREDYFAEGVISCIRGTFYEADSLSHRDVLGALMGAGVRRDAIGDIILREKACEFFLLSDLTRYLMDNLTSAGRQHLHLEQVDPSTVEKPPQAMRELRVTVSSLRLDSVLSAAFHLSRGKTAEAIQAGRVNLNSLTCIKPDKQVSSGDELSLRGSGKLRLLEVHGQTKKDRTAITVGIFL